MPKPGFRVVTIPEHVYHRLEEIKRREPNFAGRPCAQAPSRALVEQAPFEPSKPKAAVNRGPLNPEAYLKVENRHIKAKAWAYKEVVKVKTCLPLRVGPLVPGTSAKSL